MYPNPACSLKFTKGLLKYAHVRPHAKCIVIGYNAKCNNFGKHFLGTKVTKVNRTHQIPDLMVLVFSEGNNPKYL